MNRELMQRGRLERAKSSNFGGKSSRKGGQILAPLFVLWVLLKGLQRPLSMSRLPEPPIPPAVTHFEVSLRRGLHGEGQGSVWLAFLLFLLRPSLSQLCQSLGIGATGPFCQLHKYFRSDPGTGNPIVKAGNGVWADFRRPQLPEPHLLCALQGASLGDTGGHFWRAENGNVQ